MENFLQREVENLSLYLEKINNTLIVIEKSENYENMNISETSVEFFITKMIPSFTLSLLNRGNLPQMTSDNISIFFLKVIELIVNNLETQYAIPLLELLQNIFNSKKSFYDQSFYFDSTNEVHEFAEIKEHSFIARYFINNINFFGALNGFSILLKLIQSSSVSIPLIRIITKIYYEGSNYFKFKFSSVHFPILKETIFEVLLHLSDEEIKNEDLSSIQEITQNLERACRSTNYEPISKIKDEFYRLQLQMALKFFKSPFIKIRLSGLNDIKSIIQKTGIRGVMNKSSGKSLVLWIRENAILELLYRDNLHPEILRRCAEIPTFLAKENEITTKDLDLIWNAGLNKYEAITHSIYTLLSSLVSNLNIEHLNYLYTLIRKIPLHSYDSNIIQLIRSLTFYGLTLTTGDMHEYYGLEVMWEIVQDDVPLSSDLKTTAFNFINEFITWIHCYQYRMPLIEKAIENLKNHRSSCASLKVLGSVLHSYSVDHPQIMNLSTILQRLNNDYQLLEHYFNDLLYYKNDVWVQYNQNSNLHTLSSPLLHEHCFTKVPHSQEIQERLQFLQFLLQKSNLSLTQQDIDIFWECIISRSLTSEEKEAGLKWLDKKENDSGNSIFSNELFLYIFEQKLQVEIDIESLSQEGLNLILSFFKSINLKNGTLKSIKSEFIVCSFELIGIRYLWEICLTVKNSEVSKTAINALIGIQKAISPELISQTGIYRKDFIKFCIDQIAETANHHHHQQQQQQQQQHHHHSFNEKDELRILRCLTILYSYMEEFDPKELPINRHGTIGKGKQMSLKILVANKPNLTFTVDVFQNDTVSTLKDLVSSKLELKASDIRLVNTTVFKELIINNRTLSSYGVTNQHVINCISIPRRHNPIHIPFEYSPSYILLEDPTYFDHLFKLLSLPSEDVRIKAWELLMLLPTNKMILNEIENCDEAEKWTQILTSQSLYSLLYSLQIIESIVDTKGATDDEIEKKNRWGTKFEQHGGVNHLMSMITSDLYKSNLPKSKSCVALIFQIIVHFIHRVGVVEFSSTTHNSFIPIVEQILNIIQYSSSMEAPEIDDAIIVEHSLEFLIFYCYNPSTFSQFLHFPNLSNWLHQTLLLCKNSLIREHIQKAVQHLCTSVPFISNEDQMKQSNCHDDHDHDVGDDDHDHHSLIDGGIPTVRIIFDQLTPFLESIDHSANTYRQYFELFHFVIRTMNENDALKAKYETKFECLLQRLVHMLEDHPIIEYSNEIEDLLLIGIMKVLRVLLAHNHSFKSQFGVPLIDQLYSKCLFEFPSITNHDQSSLLKCKSKRSRIVAFRLLNEICKKHSSNLLYLTKKLISHHSSFPSNRSNGGETHSLQRTKSNNDDLTSKKNNNNNNTNYSHLYNNQNDIWNFSPDDLEKSPFGYVGLRNLGSTCYMNSLMQQFYMIPKFRRGFLALPIHPSNHHHHHDGSDDNNHDGDEEDGDLDDNLIYQMQKLFAYLQESHKRFYNTVGFCKAYKDYSGNSVNPSIQMDADEFFNMLFERLENAMKSTNYESFFKNYFGGKVCNQVISKECDHVSENFEDYYTISVAVKGKNTLVEALDLFVEGDILEGDNKYQCGKCNSKVDALKRGCIAELPNNLIIHMRRFEFDIEEMKRMKVNDFCQFPTTLDLEPYTKEGLARKEAEKSGKPITHSTRDSSYYQFQLVGVLVHTGHAEAGHYYSFIKDREKGAWFHFNDKEVEPFDDKEIPSRCFGGYETVSRFDNSTHKVIQQPEQRIDNAYMLFYERIQQEATPSDDIGVNSSIPEPIYQSIWKENIEFFIDKSIFDRDYFAFILQLLKSSANSDDDDDDENQKIDDNYDAKLNVESSSFRIIELATRFFINTLSHAKDRNQLGAFLELLIERYSKNLIACKWFISTAILDDWIKLFLITCPENDVREAFATLSSRILSFLSPFERNLYYVTYPSEDDRDLSFYIPQQQSIYDLVNNHSTNASSLLSSTAASVTSVTAKTSTLTIETSSLSSIIDDDDHHHHRSKQSFEITESIEDLVFKDLIKEHSSKAFVIWFIESVTKHLKYVRSNWRNLEQYFTIFREFERISDSEKSYLLSRSILSRFIDFYLGDDSSLLSMKKSDLPRVRSKIGDKFKSPNLNSMIDLFADLILHTTTHNIQSGDDHGDDHDHNHFIAPSLIQPILKLSELDKEMIITNDGFYQRLLSDNVNVERVADIIAHICWENQTISTTMLRILSASLYSDSPDNQQSKSSSSSSVSSSTAASSSTSASFDVLQPSSSSSYLMALSKLLQLNDTIQNWRVEYTMEFLLKILENSDQCSDITFFNIIRFFGSLVSENHYISQSLFSILENWIEQWLIAHPFDLVRSSTEDLIKYLIYDDCKLQIINEERKHRVFNILLELLNRSPNHIKHVKFTPHHHHHNNEFSFRSSDYKLVEYFRILRWCIGESKEYIELFLEKLDSFLFSFEAVETLQNEMDENKAQIVRLIDQILEVDLHYCAFFLEKRLFQKLLLSYYISLGNSEPNLSYNNNTLQITFRIIKRCCIFSSSFLHSFLNHKNFNWSFEFLCLASDFHLAGEQLFDTCLLQIKNTDYTPVITDHHPPHPHPHHPHHDGSNDVFVDDDAASSLFRSKLIKLIINSDKMKIRVFNYRAAALYFDHLIQCFDDLSVFCKNSGFEFVCNFDALRSSSESSSDFDASSLLVVEPTLRLLQKTTQFLSPFYHPLILQTRNMTLSSFPSFYHSMIDMKAMNAEKKKNKKATDISDHQNNDDNNNNNNNNNNNDDDNYDELCIQQMNTQLMNLTNQMKMMISYLHNNEKEHENEVYSFNKMKLTNLAIEVSQNWESKMDLFLQLQMCLNNSTEDSILIPSYHILFNLSSSDETLLEILLRQLETDHENYYHSLSSPNDLSYISGPKRPCIKAHIAPFRSIDDYYLDDTSSPHHHHLHHHIYDNFDYYLFIRKICEYTIIHHSHDAGKIQIILNLLCFVVLELISFPPLHSSFLSLFHYPALCKFSSNQIWDSYVFKSLTSHTQLLQFPECYSLIRSLFPTSSTRFTSQQKDEIIVSFQVLFSSRFQDVLIEQPSNSENFVSDMIPLVKMGCLLILDEYLSQVIQTDEFFEFINLLKLRIPEGDQYNEFRSTINDLDQMFK